MSDASRAARMIALPVDDEHGQTVRQHSKARTGVRKAAGMPPACLLRCYVQQHASQEQLP